MAAVFYRFKYLDSDGRIFRRKEFELPDDVTAVERAAELAGQNAIDIWDGARRVALVQVGDAQLNARQAGSL
jgi:hypothetical protein